MSNFELKMGDVVGIQRSYRWGTKPWVVVGVSEDGVDLARSDKNITVSPRYGLNMPFPGWLDKNMILSSTRQTDLGLDQE